MTATLYHILSLTFSQCKSIRRDVILSYFSVVWIILHVMFCMHCSLSGMYFGVPNCYNNQSWTIPVPTLEFLCAFVSRRCLILDIFFIMMYTVLVTLFTCVVFFMYLL